jgi:hypothetical protein
MSVPPHPYFLSAPIMFMGYLNGSNKYTNPIDKSIKYSMLSVATGLWSWRTYVNIDTVTRIKHRPLPLLSASIIMSSFMSGTIYCMGNLLGVAAGKSNKSQFKNLIDKPRLE